MKISDFAIANPVKIAVGVILLCIFGLIALFDVPVQLTPEVTRPTISVSTSWPGRSPEEIEQEIIERQEELLKSIEGMTNFQSDADEGRGSVRMEFEVGSNMNEVLVKVSSALQQIRDYPEDAEPPRIRTVNVDDSPIAWMALVPLPPERGELDAFLELNPQYADLLQEAIRGDIVDMPTLYRLWQENPALEPLVANRPSPRQMRDYAEDVIKPAFERLDGVANANVYGGREKQLQVEIDASKMAELGITIPQLRSIIAAENVDAAAGEVREGNRAQLAKTMGQFESPEEIKALKIGDVYVRDIANVSLSYSPDDGFMRQRGMPSLGANVQKEEGANVLEVMERVKATITQLNRTELNPRGLELMQVSDQTTYIKSATELVQNNIIIGGILAVLVLLTFLRSVRSTFVVALAIPVSVIGTFLVMWQLGRSINVISLAGMAFAVGMVVDAAIVVLENIYSHYQRGEPPHIAASRGAKEVWGAVLASTLTTLAVFVPVVFIQEQAGQLFRDIAIAISAAVALSLLVSLTVIPAAASLVLRKRNRFAETPAFSPTAGADRAGERSMIDIPADAAEAQELDSIDGGRSRDPSATAASASSSAASSPARRFRPLIAGADKVGRGFASRVSRLTEALQEGRIGKVALLVIVVLFFGGMWCFMPSRDVSISDNRYIAAPTFLGLGIAVLATGLFALMAHKSRRLALVLAMIVFSVGLSYRIMPGTEYLPEGNQNLVVARVTPPSGYNIDKMREIAATIESRLRKYWELAPGSQRAHDEIDDLHMENFFCMDRGGSMFLGARSSDPARAGDLVKVLQDATSDIPGVVSFANQASLFSRGLSGGRTIDIEITGDNLDKLIALGKQINGEVMSLFPRESTGTSVQASPSLDLGNPEIHITRDLEKASRLQLTTADLGYTINAFVDGAYAGDYWEKGRKIDIVIIAPLAQAGRIEQLEDFEIATPVGQKVRLGEVATVLPASGPDEIIRIDQQRAITIQVKPGPHLALEDVMRRIEAEIVEPIRDSGALEGGRYQIHLGGTADELRQMISALGFSMLLALVITYLLIAGLYESFLYPLVIMVSVPMAAVGGFLGLRVLNLFKEQPLDTLTMLGFIILIGTVVNNAILIVDHALVLIRRESKPHREAVADSVRGRIRPIFMSTMTTLLGMTPLVMFPGAGSELYRGLGSVVLGGLALSTVFTLILVPMLFTLVYEAQLAVRERLARGALRRDIDRAADLADLESEAYVDAADGDAANGDGAQKGDRHESWEEELQPSAGIVANGNGAQEHLQAPSEEHESSQRPVGRSSGATSSGAATSGAATSGAAPAAKHPEADK